MVTALVNSCVQMQVAWLGGVFHRQELLTYSFALQWNPRSCKLVIFSVSMEAKIKEKFFITSMLHLKSWWAIKYLFALVGLHSTSLAGYLLHVALTIPIGNFLSPRDFIWDKIPKMQWSWFFSGYRGCFCCGFFTTCNWIKCGRQKTGMNQ